MDIAQALIRKPKVTPTIKKISFPIVAIGASAGGLDAVKQLLSYLEPNMKMVFFYVQHLSPTHPSSLAFILSQNSRIKVNEAANMMRVEPGNMYVCTPNKEMVLVNGNIKLVHRRDGNLPYLPIDAFFCSLAKKYKENVIGIVLSGNATDGTLGLKAIKEEGGHTFVQDESAKYLSMPASAIASGAADFVLSPKKMGMELIRINKTGYARNAAKQGAGENQLKEGAPSFRAILDILHKTIGVDFSHYKPATINRRMQHRMAQQNVKTLKLYLKLLSANKDEVYALYKDLLINVTSFFRDKDTFACLKKKYLPHLLQHKKLNEPLRIWVPACSTGEEAYSIAILISELQNDMEKKIPVQIFATDISEKIINVARRGMYSAQDLEQVSPARIKKYFSRDGINYRVIKSLRDMCVFSTHNILSDPPFSRMDLISCRNLLIYFDAAAQKRTMVSLHFALNDSGYLLLGKAETAGTSLLFTAVSTKYKIFSRKKDNGIRKVPELIPRFKGAADSQKKIPLVIYDDTSTNYIALNKIIDTVLLSSHMPACAVINKEMDIIQFRGSTALFLGHGQGKASLNILKMIRPEFAFELRSTIGKVIKTKQAISRHGVEMQVNAKLLTVSLNVHPVDIEWNEPLLLVVFTIEEQLRQHDHAEKGSDSRTKDNRIKRLSEELNGLRGEMQIIIESQEKAYEELQAANEEIVSSNEEYQTLNEELETTKEEIEASNEELTSTNQELRMRNEMLVESNNFSEAIINTLHEPLLILNNNLEVKSANKAFYKVFNVHKDGTEGISVFELANKQWNIAELHDLLEKILLKNTSFYNFKVTHLFPGVGEKVLLLNASRIEQKSHGEQLILLAIDDITELTHTQELEKQRLHKHIHAGKIQNEQLENAVKKRTKQIEHSRKILEIKNTELEVANKDLTSFTYISSHDLQEPLRKIQVFSNIILKEEKEHLSENGKVLFNRMQDTAKRMQKLLEDLLAYSHTKNMERDFIKSSLNLIIDKVKIDLDEIIKHKNATIKYGKLYEANIIPFQFSILMNNLISNSLKFADPQRPLLITIKSRIIAGSNLKIDKISKGKKYCCVTIQDNGIGFDNQYKDRIFDVFQRLHNRDEYEGTGIGLAICKRIVEIHSGIITATGRLNKGAKFDIYLPV
ncbi:MAG: domain S-box protein [Flavipsychrobacter sp.]|nr:domain S-box protein [Flavipsychrobacter sp.]